MKRLAVIPAPGGLDCAAGPGVLEVIEARQLSARLVSASRDRVVCRFWTEKALLVCDALQLYALLWQLSQPWPWPSRWLALTRWTNAFNLDVFSFRATGAAMGSTSQPFSLWGEMPHYWLYAMVFAALPGLLVVALRLVAARWETHGSEMALARRIAWENVLLHVLYVLYLPVGLAVVRLINCDDNGLVTVDPSTFPSCWSTSHILAVGLISFAMGGSFLVGYPLWVRRQINSVVFTDDTNEHERFVQAKELEFLLGTSNAYIELYMSVYASFHIYAVHDPVRKCLLKLVLLIIFSPLRSTPPSQAHQGLQGTLFFVVILIMAFQLSWQPPYRLESTNQLAKLLLWLLVANSAIAVLCANGVRSALTVSTSVFASLSFVNALGLFATSLSVALSTRQWQRRHELDPQMPNHVYCRHACWPTHPLMSEIIWYGSELQEWVPLLQEADALALKTAVTTSTIKPFQDIGAALQKLEDGWRHARAVEHPLSGQLYQEALFLSDQYVQALAASPFKNVTKSIDAMPQLTALATKLGRRDDRHRLLRPTHRRVLSKLQTKLTWSRKQGQEFFIGNWNQLDSKDAMEQTLLCSEMAQVLENPSPPH